MNEKKIRIVAYGSLKRGFELHTLLGADAEFLGTIELRGVMFLCETYPLLFDIDPSGEEREPRAYEAEVYAVSPEAYREVRDAELPYGYEEREIATPWGAAKVYITLPETYRPEYPYIEAYTEGVVEEARRSLVA